MICEIIIATMFLLNYGYVESGPNPLTIIGGNDRQIWTYNFLVSVQYTWVDCGGSIISPIFVITAAQCVHSARANRSNILSIVVIIGSSSPLGGLSGVVTSALDLFEHPDYNNETKVNDISLLLLQVRLAYGVNIGAIRLPRELEMLHWPDTVIRAIGFGTTTRGFYTNELKEGNLLIVKNNRCQSSYGFELDSQICATNVDITLENRDEGSPVLYGDQLIGIVSRTEHSRRLGGCTVLVRVSSYLPFIEQTINGTTAAPP